MSIDGELVTFSSGRGSYTPVAMKRSSTRFSFDAHTSVPIGAPIRLAM